MKKLKLTSLCLCYAALAMSGCASSSDDETCMNNTSSCDGTCYDLTSTAEHCGDCNNDCTKAANVTGASCINSTCAITTCVNGYKDCDGNPANGCEKYVGDNGQCTDTPVDKCEPPKTQCPAGCFNLTEDKLNCGSCSNNCTDKGNITNAVCENSACKIVSCASNYDDCDKDASNGCEKYIGSGTCENPEKKPDPIEPSNCQFTISYTNADTCSSTGGSQDWNVYLIGEMNKAEDGSWKQTDENFQMRAGDNCTRSVTFNVEEGKSYKYKFYVDGWGENAYRSDASNAVDDDKNNQFTATCGGSAAFTEKAAETPQPQPEKCEVTFTYVNADTCLATGGAHDWPVYLIGDMNEWKESDANMLMAADQNCTRSITLELEKGKAQNYKFFIEGWNENSYHSDPSKLVGEEKNNQTDGTCGAEYKYVEKAPTTTQPETEKCDVTFTYVNADTCKTTGGTDQNVYLIGDMNDWQRADGNLLMSADEKCSRSITVSLDKNKKYLYKFYIAGQPDETAYHADPSKAVGEDKNNQTSGVCGEEYKYVEKEASSVVTPGEPDPIGDCKATFTFFNPWTNVASGGADDFDVYLVGSFNAEEDGTWKIGDVAWKMNSDGAGTHTISVDLAKTKSYEYKYYIDGWGNDSWKTDAEDGVSNGVAKMDTCDKNFGKPNTEGPIIPTDPEKCLATFIYTNKYTNIESGGEEDFDVYLIGSMNDWKEADNTLKMTSDGNGTHSITVELKEGEKYTFKYFVNGWGNDSYRANPYACTDEDCNSLVDMATCGQIIRYVEVPLGGNETPETPSQSSSNCSLKSAPTVIGKDISFEIVCKDGTSAISSVSGGKSPVIDGFKVTDTVTENNKYAYTVKAGENEIFVPVWVENNKFNWHDAVLYFAFTDRFKDGDPSNNNPKTNASVEGSANAQWLGGDFKGMRQKVEEGYFERLGVNTLWISSISMNAQGISWGTGNDARHSYSAYHSYWPVSSFMTDLNMNDFQGAKSENVDITMIEPHFGTMDELTELVDACHKRGIRVLVDFAANHVHKDSPMVKKHPEWFNDSNNPQLCDNNNNWDRYSEKCWFSQDLPDINYDNADARKAMVDHAIYLIKKTNIDGFRVDAVKHMNIQFIKDLRAATDSLYANSGDIFYMVGETFTGDVNLLNKYIGGDLLHAQFDFPMYYALQSHILGLGNYASVAQLSNRFNSDLMGTFMGNHDVARAVSVAAGQNQNKWCNNSEITDWLPYLKIKTAWTILLTNPGVPLIYYGDEYGQEGCNDPDNRRMMKFDNLNDQQQGTLEYVSLLGQIRKNHKALTRGHRENLSYGGGYWCYKVSDGNESIIVGISRADGGDNSGCDLKGSYNLQNLLDEGHETRNGVTGLDLSNDRLQVYLVK